MANALYDLGREAFLNGGVNFGADTIKVAMVTSGYVANLATDQYFSAVPTADIVGTAQTLASKTTAAGVAGAGNVTFSAVTGSQVTQLVIYKDTGTASTSPLIALIDTATGLPVTPNGGDITIAWDTGANKIFKL